MIELPSKGRNLHCWRELSTEKQKEPGRSNIKVARLKGTGKKKQKGPGITPGNRKKDR